MRLLAAPTLLATLLLGSCADSESQAADTPGPWAEAARSAGEALDHVGEGLRQGADQVQEQWETEWREEVRQRVEKVEAELDAVGERLAESEEDATQRLRQAADRLAAARADLVAKLEEAGDRVGEEWQQRSAELEQRLLEAERNLADLLEKRERARSGEDAESVSGDASK